MIEALPTLLAGALITLQLTAIATVLGLMGGIVLGVARLSKVKLISLSARVYIDFFRGTPTPRTAVYYLFWHSSPAEFARYWVPVQPVGCSHFRAQP